MKGRQTIVMKIMLNKSLEEFFRESKNENIKRLSVHEAETGR